MVSSATSDRACRLLKVAAGSVLLVGLVALFYGAGVKSLPEVKLVGLWYVGHQLASNPLCGLLLLVTLLAGLAYAAVAGRARRAFRRDVARGAVPSRRVDAVSIDRLVNEARARLEPAITGGRVDRVVDALLGLPVDLGAGGLLLEPGPMVVEVRLQMAMERLAVGSLPPNQYQDVLERLRQMAGIEEATGRGRLDLRSAEGTEPIRVALEEGVNGVKTRLQLLQRAGFNLTVEELDLPKPALTALARALVERRGVILVTGPPDSGVTGTLYAVAHYIDRQRQTPGLVASVERPVRQELPFIQQHEVGAGSPAAVLDSLLADHQHEVVIVRHLDSPELVERAFEAGGRRLMLGGLPALGAFEAAQRAAGFVGGARVGERLLFALGQRLARRICPACRVEVALEPQQQAQLEQLALAVEQLAGPFYEGSGCSACGRTGFAGRVPVYEWISASDELTAALAAGGAHDELARAPGCGRFVDQALELARAGETTVADLIAAALSSPQGGSQR